MCKDALWFCGRGRGFVWGLLFCCGVVWGVAWGVTWGVKQKFRRSRFVIQNWMRRMDAIQYMGLWEQLNNPNFNRIEFDTFRSEADVLNAALFVRSFLSIAA